MANYCAIHSHRITIQPKDMRLVDTLRQLMGGVCYNQAAFLAPALDRAIPAARETEKRTEKGQRRGRRRGQKRERREERRGERERRLRLAEKGPDMAIVCFCCFFYFVHMLC